MWAVVGFQGYCDGFFQKLNWPGFDISGAGGGRVRVNVQ